MLILRRRQNEGIVIEFNGVQARILVIEIRTDGTVALGIDAPACVRVDREEITLRRKAPNDAPRMRPLPRSRFVRDPETL